MTMDELRGELYERTSGLLTLLGVSWSGTGPAPALDRPIGWGYQQVGLVPASGPIPDDADLVTISTADFYLVADHAEYRVLSSFLARWTQVTTKVGQGEVRLSDLRTSVERRLAQLVAILGIDVPTLSAGRISIARPTTTPASSEFSNEIEEFPS